MSIVLSLVLLLDVLQLYGRALQLDVLFVATARRHARIHARRVVVRLGHEGIASTFGALVSVWQAC